MGLWQDLQFAIRLLVKDKWFTLVAAVALALGIGVNATVFTFVNAVLIRGLPFDDPDRIMALSSRDPVRDRDMGVSYLDFKDWRAATQTFTALAAYTGSTMNVSDEGRAPERFSGAFVSANAFRLIGAAPILGRDFLPEDDRPGAAAVVLLGNGVWKNRYGSDPAVIGRTIRVNDMPSVVIGVMPEGFKFPQNADLWQPLVDRAASSSSRSATRAASRCSAGSRPACRARRRRPSCIAIGQRLTPRLSGHQQGRPAEGADLQRARQRRPDPRGVSVADGRGRLRAADRLRQRRQPAAGALGAPLARDRRARVDRRDALAHRPAAADGKRAARAHQRRARARRCRSSASVCSTPRRRTSASRTGSSSRWTARVFAFLAAICLGTGIVFGLAPALHVSKTDVNEILKEGGRSGSAGIRVRRWSGALIIGELALTLALLAGAGFMMRNFLTLYRMDLGIETVASADDVAGAARAEIPGDRTAAGVLPAAAGAAARAIRRSARSPSPATRRCRAASAGSSRSTDGRSPPANSRRW